MGREQKVVMELFLKVVYQVLSPVQAALFVVESFPYHCDVLALANVLSMMYTAAASGAGNGGAGAGAAVSGGGGGVPAAPNGVGGGAGFLAGVRAVGIGQQAAGSAGGGGSGVGAPAAAAVVGASGMLARHDTASMGLPAHLGLPGAASLEAMGSGGVVFGGVAQGAWW